MSHSSVSATILDKSGPDGNSESGFPPGLQSKYEPVRLLNVGAFGTVWQARELETGRLVALKILLAKLLADPAAVSRFRHEAELAQSIRHPAVVQALDFGISGSVGYIAFPLIEGCTLRDKIAQGAMTMWQSLLIVIRLCDALAEIHRRGIVHRDLKPENVLLAGHRLPMLTDFGLSKSGRSTVRTLDGVILGTPAYLAPEQLEREESTAASDQFSLGVILYEMLAGGRPFTGGTLSEEAIARVTGEAVPIRNVLPQLDQGVANVVMKMLARNPGCRFKSMRAVHRALQLAAQRLQRGRMHDSEGQGAFSDPLSELPAAARPSGARASSETYRVRAVRSLGRAIRSVRFAAIRTVRSRVVAPVKSIHWWVRAVWIVAGLSALAAVVAWFR